MKIAINRISIGLLVAAAILGLQYPDGTYLVSSSFREINVGQVILHLPGLAFLLGIVPLAYNYDLKHAIAFACLICFLPMVLLKEVLRWFIG